MRINQYAHLVNPLKGFEAPDTTSQSQGLVAAGEYLVKEYRENYPTETTDYALIHVPALGDEDTWICTRWKDRSYVTLKKKQVTPASRLHFDDDTMAVKEKALIALLPNFHEFTYDLDLARYPYALSGFKAPVAPPKTNNCCTFVEALVVKAWENSFPDFTWSIENHKQMMIFSADDFYSPVTCLVNAEIALPVNDDDQSPHPWTVVQGWRKQWTSGHTFFILDHHVSSDRVLTLESNASYLLNGVGFRMVGNLRDYPKPPAQWWENDQLWTWERFKSVYRSRKQCVLKVKNRNWC